jgi:DNA-directed RNA polymerase subunit RPC12/RpoP
MKLRCPRCQQKLSVPDKHAGRTIRCPTCNRAFNVPKPTTAVDGPGAGPGLDLEGLAKLEAQSTEMAGQELAEAKSAILAQKAADQPSETVRTCPTCHKETSVDDPYAEVLCSNCWNPIPALIKGSGATHVRPGPGRRARPGATGQGGFYAELASSVTYPVSALSSLATAAGIAVLAALAPVALITGWAQLMEQGAAGTVEGVQKADLSGVSLVLTGIFAAEVVFFSAVALHAFLDVLRITSIGQDRPPNLTWSPSQWGKSFVAYLILAIYLAAVGYLVAALTVDPSPMHYLAKADLLGLAQAGGPAFLVGMVVVTFAIPMHLIGIAMGTITQGLHPLNVVKSIGRTHVHYVFLVLILCVYGTLFGWAAAAIAFDWFLPQVDLMISGSQEGDLAQVALSLLAWGLVIGFFFYSTYLLARLHGLFARTFQTKLLF